MRPLLKYKNPTNINNKKKLPADKTFWRYFYRCDTFKILSQKSIMAEGKVFNACLQLSHFVADSTNN